MTEWLTVREYAALFHVHRHTVYKWRDEGFLTITRVHTTIRILNIPPRLTDSTKQDVKVEDRHSQAKRVVPVK
jgi:excisionase family DNA binding protein